jgi:hypothetical protein
MMWGFGGISFMGMILGNVLFALIVAAVIILIIRLIRRGGHYHNYYYTFIKESYLDIKYLCAALSLSITVMC